VGLPVSPSRARETGAWFKRLAQSPCAFLPRRQTGHKHEEKNMKTKKSQLLAVNPVQELADATEALQIMRENLRSATAELRKSGLMVETIVTDHHGKQTKVQRVSPMVRVQREAMRTIGVLKKQIALLQKEVQENAKPLTAFDLMMQAKKEKEQ
jgi:hypothetical protein